MPTATATPLTREDLSREVAKVEEEVKDVRNNLVGVRREVAEYREESQRAHADNGAKLDRLTDVLIGTELLPGFVPQQRTKSQDHEERIGKLENFRWYLAGAIAVGTAIGGVAMQVLGKVWK